MNWIELTSRLDQRLARRKAYRKLCQWWFRGNARFCPVCRSELRRFCAFGTPPRPDARCPVCWSLERHRLLRLFLERHTDLFDARPRRVLHFAPEPWLTRLLRSLPGVDYLSADLREGAAMQSMDITALPLADASFDVVFCSHVLEHVQHDLQAMREIHRVLRPDGWAALIVPVRQHAQTVEDASVTDPAQRLALFGQEDHVRYYGSKDFAHRLEQSGFTVVHFTAQDVVLNAEEAVRVAVKQRDLFFCRRVPHSSRAFAG